MRNLVLFTSLLIQTACGGVTLEGQILDGMTNAPRADLRMVARTTAKDAGMTCQVFEGTTDASGNFTISGLCPGLSYEVNPVDETLWFPEFGGVPSTGTDGPKTIKAWRAPSGDGVYRLSGDTLSMIRTSADVQTTIALNGGGDLRYPSEIPAKVEVIGPDDFLVLAGSDAIAKTNFYPLYKAWEVGVGTEAAPSKLTAWFAGTQFDADGNPTVVGSKAPNKDHTTKKERDPKAVAYIRGSALEAHRYSVFKDGDRRMHILDFGKPFVAPERPVPGE